MKEFIFDRYRLFYLSGPSTYRAKITCYNGNERVAMVFFIEDQRNLPDNDLDAEPMKIYYSLLDFPNLLTVLENEAPLSIYIHDNGKTCEIGKRVFN